ncbi:SDR family NAD(P)-dependent oxidoreductase [Hymenobacter sp. HMF4947]|uniref:SDR family NAD(P)-dependent oxidoreductase n=1 Tax=Hymenobacter ginkgonis TaxID=2682976 RepID=A0A7K1TGE8_9BACT|nr:SDR family NAD(P)-dependent oxidoreductase [Hymenobacter ginkgonis]MVN77487.1 SDR family NAD(P)-dependent oxidoreductase [Hymenobacter ginkgonis]
MKNKIAIIGAGSGISQAVAHRFGQEGYEVVLIARNAARLQERVAELQAAGIVATSAVADSSQPDQLKQALTGLDGLRVVHYNAAALRSADVLAETAESLLQDFAVNVVGLLTAVQAALPQLEAQRGSVLITGGGLAKHPHPAYASLALGKAAQANLANSLAQAVQPKGVYVGVLQINAQVSESDAVHNPTAIAQRFWAMHTGRTQGEVEL